MIAIATSTRADWGLLAPLAKEMRRRGIAYTVLASNMHLMPEMGETIEEIRDSGEDPVELATAAPTTEETFANTAKAYGKWMEENSPEAVVILGDRYEMLGVASAAILKRVPVVHIAGGTVSEGAIDNAIRNAISQLASLHLAETDLCGARLRDMGIPAEKIFVTGALGTFNAMRISRLNRKEFEESLGMSLPDEFFVATLHPATLDSVSPCIQMRNFLDGIGDFLDTHGDYGVVVTYPNNDTDPRPLIDMIEGFAADRHPQVIAVPSLGMLRYLSAVALSAGVVGNSSSGVVEVASLCVPTLDVGIRQKGRECAPSVVHCGSDRDSIREGLETLISPEVKKIALRGENPYCRKNVPSAMLDAIISAFPSCLPTP